MRMRRQAVVPMRWDLMIVLACFIGGVDVHDDAAEIAHVVEELMADLLGDGMPFSH